MKSILVLSPHPELAQTISSGLNPEQYRVVHRVTAEEVEPLLAHGLVSACILDVELTGVQGLWVIERIRRRAAGCPVIIYTGDKRPEWEEEAYLQGVTHVLTKPVRARILTTVLDRTLATKPSAALLPPTAPVQSATSGLQPSSRTFATETPASGFDTATLKRPLSILRDFSSILTHSLDAPAMLKQFLQQMREILSVNRATIFLRQAGVSLGETTSHSRRLKAVSAIGLSSGLLEHFDLSLDAGIGAQVLRLGRILRASSDEARNDIETRKEFELLGAQVAVPILDRETLVGVAVFDGRVTGEPLVNSELELIFHLLEHVGLAIRNIWLHDQLNANNEMMSGVLRELNSACVVVNRDLVVLHANKMARKHFGPGNRITGELEFTDLPQALSSKIYQVLRTGAAVSPFKYEPEDSKGGLFSVSVVPFQRGDSSETVSALMMVEDLTQSEQVRKQELELSNLRLIQKMADRLAAEIGNAMVPISLTVENLHNKEMRAQLEELALPSTKRVIRLKDTMRFLGRESLVGQDSFPLQPLIEEAFEEALKQQQPPAKSAKLTMEPKARPVIVLADRSALKHAFTELMINAVQANTSDARVSVRLLSGDETEPGQLVVEVQDNGAGFASEAFSRAPAPFFTTRVVGVGLGLWVSRRIVEAHRGKLEIAPPVSGQGAVVRVMLPASTTSSPATSAPPSRAANTKTLGV